MSEEYSNKVDTGINPGINTEINNEMNMETEDQMIDKSISLFRYIMELNKIKQKTITNVSDYDYYLPIDKIPLDPDYVTIHDRNREMEEESPAEDSYLLSVRKPDFDKCPALPEILIEWMEAGWDDFRQEASHKAFMVRDYIVHPIEQAENISEPSQVEETENVSETPSTEAEEKNPYYEYFEDDAARLHIYQAWLETRADWVLRQQELDRIRNLFTDLYQIYVDLQRDSETMELVVADGFLRVRDQEQMNHPLITRRIGIDYDPDRNQMNLKDVDVSTELYSAILQEIPDINYSAISELSDRLREEDYHPLDRTVMPDFLKALVYQLSSESLFAPTGDVANWQQENRILLYLNPCYILRKRLDGTIKTIEHIMEHIQDTGEIPDPIRDIISGGLIEVPEDLGQESLEEQLASVGGESVDILLSKEANKEQLEIARRIERYNAVLVQGPPGTGKTHTIANLMGHLLAQGKSVLVTSHTTKALNVLKDKLTPDLRDLCVSVLDDSNVDMEKSIDGITNYMSQTTSFELKKEISDLEVERNDVIKQLADVRKKIYALIKQECESIVYDGEDYSPSQMASYLLEHARDLSYIPGNVKLYQTLPLSLEQLSDLYQSNRYISSEEEQELSYAIPDPAQLFSVSDFQELCDTFSRHEDTIRKISGRHGWEVKGSIHASKLTFLRNSDQHAYELSLDSFEQLRDLRDYCSDMEKTQSWMLSVAADGMSGAAYKEKWTILIDKVRETHTYAQSVMTELFGKCIESSLSMPTDRLISTLSDLKLMYGQNGKISRLNLLFNKAAGEVLDGIQINHRAISSAEDCDMVIHFLQLKEKREDCQHYWDSLFASYQVPDFYKLDEAEPERVAVNMLPDIEHYLNWYDSDYRPLIRRLEGLGMTEEMIFESSTLDSAIRKTDKIFQAIQKVLPDLCTIAMEMLAMKALDSSLEEKITILAADKRQASQICSDLIRAMRQRNREDYAAYYSRLSAHYVKYDLQSKREQALEQLSVYAPQWAESIRQRKGIHGESILPEHIEEAWRWKQFHGILEELTREPFDKYQEESLSLSKDYRKVTADYASKLAWYHLLKATEADIDMKQALIGWKQTVKRIGKGTGKNAALYKAKARELMKRCQKAVPAWIMPIGKALESLDPRSNRFDVIIIDEASQSDLSALALLYMGKKLIIVGDDKQVSPMGIGNEIEQMNHLKEMYIEHKIPNDHLYDAKTSVYDIAATTFQPLMLKEHFRCVPEIIGFSNMLSYDYKIKPLREAGSSNLSPAVVNYRVTDGARDDARKTNEQEARTIVALLKACIEEEEYADKTFGIISLLGDQQVKLIQSILFEEIDPKDITQRKILCGNSSNFQGDERDVVFLSLVDSGKEEGPLRMQNFGADDAMRKRYNVAASRARDQLWVVHSLDAANDLKPGDLRKTLIDYASNPQAYAIKHDQIVEKSESPFEERVASALTGLGYHVEQQWEVGAYRLDMVVLYGKNAIAIECDGERYHSGEAQIREDMERQTILERLGWRFIRIRGSEFFRDPEAAIRRVVANLSQYGILPEEVDQEISVSRETELLSGIRRRAAEILEGSEEGSSAVDLETIAYALDGKEAVSDSDGSAVEDSEVDSMADRPENTRADSPGESPENDSVDAPEEGIPDQSVCFARVETPLTEAEDRDKDTGEDRLSQGVSGEHDQPFTLDDVISWLDTQNIMYIDEREEEGDFWVIGGKELLKDMNRFWKKGFRFEYKKKGWGDEESWRLKV